MRRKMVWAAAFFAAVFLALALFVAFGPARTLKGKLVVHKVTENANASVYAIVGENMQRSPENFADNATFGLVVTKAGAVLIDPGGSYKGARAIDDAVRTVTAKPVVTVIDTGGQDHRWLGNGYFKARGARIIASRAAVADQKDRGSMQLSALGLLIKDKALKGTEEVHADKVFKESLDFTLGGVKFHIENPGPAHTPGDSFVWLADIGVVFTGDIVYVDRLPSVLGVSDYASWINAFKAVAALKAKYIVPGHGPPTDIKRARFETYEYLLNLHERIKAYIAKGGDAQGSVLIDQSRFKDIPAFDILAKRNAQAVFIQMEFE